MPVKQKPQENVVIEYTDWTKFLPWLTQIAFVLSVALVIARMMMLESLHDPLDALEATTQPPRACGPAGSVVLDLLCCVPALLVLLRRVVDKAYIIRLSWAEALLGAFAAWALLSPIWAANKSQAMVLSLHLVAAAALFWATAQLVRSWLRLRIVAGVCLGLLLVYTAQGLMYRFVDLPDTVNFWKQHRTEEMHNHGWQEGDFSLMQYEQKLLNGEMVIFQASPNSVAAAMMLMSLVVAGVGIQRIVNKDEPGMIGATIVPLPFAAWIIWYTHCNAAFVSPVIAAIILIGIWKFGPTLSRKRTAAYMLGVSVVLMGTIALVGHGLFHGSLPSASLNFRWRYWVASMRLFKMHPMLGVGFGNFGNAYLQVRLPAAAEEIKDPHNLVVRAATELGIVGATLLVAWLARVWWEWTNPRVPGISPSPGTPGEGRGEGLSSETRNKSGPTSASRKMEQEPHGTRRMFVTIAAISLLGVAINILAGTDLSADASWVTFELLRHAVYAALILIGLAIIVVRSTKQTSLDDRPAPWLLYTMLAALAVFLIHNTIDFSLFETGPMMLFMLIGGAVIGVRSPSAAGARKRTAIAICAFSASLLAWLIAGIFIAEPLMQAEDRAHAGDVAYHKHNFSEAAEHYEAAFTTAPAKDPDYAARAALALMHIANADGQLRTNLGLAIAANPNDPMGTLTRARYNLQQHPDQQPEIRRDYERALELNPNDIDTRIEYAKVLEGFGDHPAAAEEYRAALKTNDGFDLTEPKRLVERSA